MKNSRHFGKLHFIKNGTDNEIKVYWNMLNGDLKRSLWKISISFTKDFSVPSNILSLLSNALEDGSVRVVFELENEKKIDCVIHSIVDLSDSGLIEISSPEFGRSKFI